MAHSMLKPYNFLLYFLSIIAFFFLGIAYAGLVEAGKGQMLAGGAIVLGYGLIGSFIGFCISLVIAYKASRKTVFSLNIILGLAIVAFWAYFYIKYQNRQKEKELDQQEIPKTEQTPTTSPAEAVQEADGNNSASEDGKTTQPMAYMFRENLMNLDENTTGLGMFIPNFYENNTLYFYGNPNLEKSVMDHAPTDSITFRQSQYGGFEIETAPPWLVPDHLKLDYDLLYFQVQTITHNFIEVTVNTTNNQTFYIDRYAGKILYWPEFFLNVNSVEFTNPEKHNVYVRPFESAGEVSAAYSFMKPIKVKQAWMYVELLNDDFESLAEGWIQWMKDGKLLISYSLLS